MKNFADDKNADAQAIEISSRYRTLTEVWVAFMVAVNIALAVCLAVFFNLNTVRRLGVVMDNTFRLGARQPLNSPVGGGDEIAHLDTVFHQMARDLEEASQRKQELVSMVSHDLRTPLMSMQTSLELLQEGILGALPDKARNEISVAQYSTTRLIQLINDLLDIDKLEAGQFHIERRDSDIGWVFERCITTVRAFAQRHGVTIEVPEDDEDVQIYADPDRLAQVIVNLLSNAIKYSMPGSKVTLTYEDSVAATLVKIIDSGRGIPEGFEKRIFERFQQVDPKDARERKEAAWDWQSAKRWSKLMAAKSAFNAIFQAVAPFGSDCRRVRGASQPS